MYILRDKGAGTKGDEKDSIAILLGDWPITKWENPWLSRRDKKEQ